MGKKIDFEQYRDKKSSEASAAAVAEELELLESMSRHPAMLARRARERKAQDEVGERKEAMKKLITRAIDEANRSEGDEEPRTDSPNHE